MRLQWMSPPFPSVGHGKTLLIALLLGVCFCLAPWRSSHAEDLKVAVLPRFSSELTSKQTQQLAEYLTKELGKPVTPIVAANFKDYTNLIKNGEIAIGFENPVVFMSIADKHEALAVAVQNKATKLRGIIIVRQDSPISNLNGLRDKLVSAVGEDSAGGYVSQRLTLRESGLEPGRDFKVVFGAENKQENVILAVYTGDADAGFVRRDALDQVKDFIAVNQIRILAETAWLPNWIVSANSSLDPALKTALTEAVTKISMATPLAQTLGVEGFQQVDMAEFAELRQGL